MREKFAVPAVACALGVTVASVVPAAGSTPRGNPGPGGVAVEIETLNGSGCRPGTVAVGLSPDKDRFTIIYGDYVAQVGGGSRPIDYRKNCQVNLQVHVPPGYTYAVSTVEQRGFASLRPEVEALLAAGHYFQGSPTRREFTHRLFGPYDDNWRFVDMVPESELAWKPCGEARNLHINTQVRLNTGTSDPSEVSFVSMESMDEFFRTSYHLTWKTCP
ncbi:DUF4360 domain-containing protein [Actinomadura roseirufa]|uniref:DUF4360 domain-containing protein n=1 Tax=Actinomadura roseirufa TaxID=2094049 RepID=UPI0010413EE9|nr:DUF4360 domain-containing protein [Actinomadura roseirufa]